MMEEDKLKHIESVSEFETLRTMHKGKLFVFFHAHDCMYCKKMLPVIEEMAQRYSTDNLIFVAIDVQQEKKFVSTYNLEGVPVSMIFDDGKMITSHEGQMSKKDLSTFMKSNGISLLR